MCTNTIVACSGSVGHQAHVRWSVQSASLIQSPALLEGLSLTAGHLFVTFPTLLTATTARRNASPTTALKDGIATEPPIASALTAKVTRTVPLDSSAAIESVLSIVESTLALR